MHPPFNPPPDHAFIADQLARFLYNQLAESKGVELDADRASEPEAE